MNRLLWTPVALLAATALLGCAPPPEAPVAGVPSTWPTTDHELQDLGALPWINILSERWGVLAEPRWTPGGPDRLDRPLDLEVEPRRVGETLHLDLTLSNPGSGGAFPPETSEVWLEVLVMDVAWRGLSYGGNILNGEVSMPVARLGPQERDTAGEPLQRHRVLDLGTVGLRRSLPLGGSVLDTVEIDLSPAIAYPVEVRARWLVRRRAVAFAQWRLGEPNAAYEVATAHAFVDERGLLLR